MYCHMLYKSLILRHFCLFSTYMLTKGMYEYGFFFLIFCCTSLPLYFVHLYISFPFQFLFCISLNCIKFSQIVIAFHLYCHSSLFHKFSSMLLFPITMQKLFLFSYTLGTCCVFLLVKGCENSKEGGHDRKYILGKKKKRRVFIYFWIFFIYIPKWRVLCCQK